METCCTRKTYRSNEEKKVITSRLNRIIGQLAGIKKMVDEDRYCDEILIQLSAVNKAVKSIANIVLEKHLQGCVVEDIQSGKTEIIADVMQLLKRFQ